MCACRIMVGLTRTVESSGRKTEVQRSSSVEQHKRQDFELLAPLIKRCETSNRYVMYLLTLLYLLTLDLFMLYLQYVCCVCVSYMHVYACISSLTSNLIPCGKFFVGLRRESASSPSGQLLVISTSLTQLLTLVQMLSVLRRFEVELWLCSFWGCRNRGCGLGESVCVTIFA